MADSVSGKAAPAIVTGAARGIGAAIAHRLAQDAHPLVVVDRDEPALSAAVAELAGEGAEVVGVEADLTDLAGPEAVVARAREAFGGAEVLVNNAGIVSYADFLSTSPTQLRQLLNIDVEAVYLMTQAFVGDLRRRGRGGCVINLGTSHALTGVAGTSAYAAAKGAVHAMTRALAVELAPLGIRVNTLAPGTTMTARVQNELPAELIAQRMRQIPLHRGASVEEVADAAAFMIRAEFMTGADVVLDGGFSVYGDA